MCQGADTSITGMSGSRLAAGRVKGGNWPDATHQPAGKPKFVDKPVATGLPRAAREGPVHGTFQALLVSRMLMFYWQSKSWGQVRIQDIKNRYQLHGSCKDTSKGHAHRKKRISDLFCTHLQKLDSKYTYTHTHTSITQNILQSFKIVLKLLAKFCKRDN